MGRGGEVTRGSEARGGKAGRWLGREWFRRWCGWLMETYVAKNGMQDENGIQTWSSVSSINVNSV